MLGDELSSTRADSGVARLVDLLLRRNAWDQTEVSTTINGRSSPLVVEVIEVEVHGSEALEGVEALEVGNVLLECRIHGLALRCVVAQAYGLIDEGIVEVQVRGHGSSTTHTITHRLWRDPTTTDRLRTRGEDALEAIEESGCARRFQQRRHPTQHVGRESDQFLGGPSALGPVVLVEEQQSQVHDVEESPMRSASFGASVASETTRTNTERTRARTVEERSPNTPISDSGSIAEANIAPSARLWGATIASLAFITAAKRTLTVPSGSFFRSSSIAIRS